MDEISLTINSQEVKANKGMTVLEAAQTAGIYIPTLCHHPDMEPYGACRLCVVEIEKVRGLPTACTMPASDGMIVQTESPQITQVRRIALELMLSEHPNACLTCHRREYCSPFDICLRNVAVTERCVTCPKNGHCELQNVARYIGLDDIRFGYTSKGLPVKRDDPLFDRDYNLCVMCGRCVRMCQEVRGIGAIDLAYRGIQATVSTPFDRPLIDSACKFDCACVEVCPTGALMDKGGEWKTEAEREAFLVPCKHACPLGIDVPRYVRLIAERKFADALAVVAEKTPFPLICGTICHHPCESKCRRGEVNEPIAIMALKRFVAERAPEGGVRRIRFVPPSGKRVAVVGSGPAGLTAAYYLARLCGHSVTVFEALPEPGGMMRVGIPKYRLPRKVLDAEIDLVRHSGVEIRTSTKINSLDELFEQGYDAIFVAIGAHQDVKTRLEGEEGPKVLYYVSFLRQVNSGRRLKPGNKVAVIGGEVGAIDAARTALRLGAKEVTILCPTTEGQMPGVPAEIDELLEEGAKILFLTTLERIIHENGKMRVEYASLQPDQPGKFALDIDTVIFASSRIPEIPEKFGLQVNDGNTVWVDPTTLATSREGVFAGGDAVSGAASVTEAMAAGRQAAISIDRYLGGSGDISETLAAPEEISPCLGMDEDFGRKPRQQIPSADPNERLNNFAQVELGFNTETAVNEAKRCLRCDLRLQIGKPKAAPLAEQLEEILAPYAR